MDKAQETINTLIEITQHQAANIDALGENVNHLADQVSARPTKRAAYGFSIILNLVSIILVGIMLLQIHSNSETNKATLNLVEDCVTPQGECAQRSRNGSAFLISLIICNQERIAVIANPDHQVLPECIPVIAQIETNLTDTLLSRPGEEQD